MKKFYAIVAAALVVFCAASCEKAKVNHTGPAKFVLTNLTTGEEKTFLGDELGYTTPVLEVRNNDSLKVKFVPELEYVKHGFDVVFTLFNGTQVVDNEYPYLYKCKVSDIAPGQYTFKCSAVADKGDVNIKESSSAYVMVEE